MNKEDGVISKPLEATTEMISEHLESTVDVDDVENILNLTKENINFSKERRKNTTVISYSRNSIDTEEMDILNNSDFIKQPKMNEEDGVIPTPLEATTELIFEHLNSKVEVDDVANILNPTKENNNLSEERRKNTTVISSSRNSIDTEEMDIVNESDSIKNPKMNEEDGVISKPLEATTEMISEHLN